MQRIQFIDLQLQYARLQAEINPAIQQVLSQCNFILGEQVTTFEAHFADFIDVRHAVGVSSGLDALRIALYAASIAPGDEVVLPANTFIATALAVSSLGARPVFVDCDPATYNMDVEKLAEAVTPQTRAIIPVHLTGQSVDMDPVLTLAKSRGLTVIEDAAQAHGARYKSCCCGAMGMAGCFSFYPGKNLGAYGDGGIITTNDDALAERLERLRNYGQRRKYHHTETGFNARLDTIQAAILDVKLKYLNDWNAARQEHAELYKRLLAGVGDIRVQTCAPFSTHVYHLFVIETQVRDALQGYLNEAGVQTVIHYPIPIHLQEAYAYLGYQRGDFPRAEALASRTLSLPMYPELTNSQIEYVVEVIKHFFAKSQNWGQ